MTITIINHHKVVSTEDGRLLCLGRWLPAYFLQFWADNIAIDSKFNQALSVRGVLPAIYRWWMEDCFQSLCAVVSYFDLVLSDLCFSLRKIDEIIQEWLTESIFCWQRQLSDELIEATGDQWCIFGGGGVPGWNDSVWKKSFLLCSPWMAATWTLCFCCLGFYSKIPLTAVVSIILTKSFVCCLMSVVQLLSLNTQLISSRIFPLSGPHKEYNNMLVSLCQIIILQGTNWSRL